MASRVLYPAVIDSYMPAFQVGDGCKISFSLSKFNVSSDFSNVQVSIVKQGSGISAVNPVDLIDDEDNRYRSNGNIILNVIPTYDDETKLQSFLLTSNDIRNGQSIGSLYKVQIRLSNITYNEDKGLQSNQLNDPENALSFSEQSTVCVIKAIGEINLIMNEPFMSTNDDSLANPDTVTTFYQSTVEVGGYLYSEDSSEKLYSYKMNIYRDTGTEDTLIESSGTIYANKYQDNNDFFYSFKTEFEDGQNCRLEITFTTINGYTNTYNQNFLISQAQDSEPNIKIVTVDTITTYESHNHSSKLDIDSPSQNNNPYSATGIGNNIDYGLTSKMIENEEGRIGIKLQPTDYDEETAISKNLCIRRADEKDNFTKQTDIKIIPVINQKVSELDVFYDYTIESGVYYKYGVQIINNNGSIRSLMNIISDPICREFEYSFLLGSDKKQLKLKYNNDMGSYKIQQLESKVETIGGKYPIVTRNAAVEYRIFPINGLISFSIDDNKLFYTREEIYGVQKDNKDRPDHYDTSQYNYTQERDFRNKVLEQLHDGTPKLFKSPTEGNVIARLTEISCTPAQNLGRMIYSFSSTGNEFAEASMANYLKYNFYEVGECVESFATTETKIGQLCMDFTKNTNVIKEIFKKYDSGNEQIAGKVRKIQDIYAIKFTFNNKPMRLTLPNSDSKLFLGNKITIQGSQSGQGVVKLIVLNDYYALDENLKFTQPSQGIYFDLDSDTESINVNVDFLYTITIDDWDERGVKSQTSMRGVGQIFVAVGPNTSLFNLIYQKYYIDTDEKFMRLSRLTSIEIEADPGSLFAIQDNKTDDLETHEINKTGILNFYNINDIIALNYLGRRNSEDTSLNTVKVTYHYTALKGEYERK